MTNQGERGPTGDHGQSGERGERGATGATGPKGQSFLAFNQLQLIAFLLVIVAAAYGNYKAYDLSKDVQKAQDASETARIEGRDQICRSFESAHRQEIEALDDTYQFLLQETPEERKSTLSKFIIAQVPEQEDNAESDLDGQGVLVPKYCDTEGVGLPEPDPHVPARPRGLDGVLPPRQPLPSD